MISWLSFGTKHAVIIMHVKMRECISRCVQIILVMFGNQIKMRIKYHILICLDNSEALSLSVIWLSITDIRNLDPISGVSGQCG